MQVRFAIMGSSTCAMMPEQACIGNSNRVQEAWLAVSHFEW